MAQTPTVPAPAFRTFASWRGFAVFYAFSLLGGALGQGSATGPGALGMFWLPVGMLCAMLLVSRRRDWPTWIAVAAAAELTGNALWWHAPWLPALGCAAANAIEAAAGAALLRRFPGGRAMAGPGFLVRPTQGALFVLCCGVLAPAVGATIIAAINQASGKASFASTWPDIWLGDAAGMLLAMPMTLVALDLWRLRRAASAATLFEVAMLVLSLGAVAVAAFLGALPTPYLVLPLLMWAGLRFQMRGALPALGLLVVVGTALLFRREGRFADPAMLETEVVALQVFYAIAAVSTLFAATLSAQHAEARKALSDANAILTGRVAIESSRLASALRAGRLGVLELDSRRRRARLDPTTRRLLGIAEAQVGFDRLEQAIHPDDRPDFAARLALLGAGDGDGRMAIECRIAAAGERWVMVDGEHAADQPRAPAGGVAVCIVQDISERRLAQRRQRMLIDELSHRVKNTLTMVQAIAMQTLQKHAERPARDAFLSRIAAFARGHDLLAQRGGQGAPLDDIVRLAIAPFDPERFDLEAEGACVFLPANQVLAVALALHELCTNATKYGALGMAGGRVLVRWEHLAQGARFRLAWRESGGPPVSPPRHKGFGSVLLEQVLAQDLRGMVTVRYREEGVECDIEAPLVDQPPATIDPARDTS